MHLRLLSFLVAVSALAQAPKTWDANELADWAKPIAALGVRPGHFTEAEYYSAPVDNVRTYPVYRPDREPAGYWESLKAKKPEPLMPIGDTNWVEAGRRVFEGLDVPGFRHTEPKIIAKFRSTEYIKKAKAWVEPDGTLFGYRWVPTERGLAISITNCSGCHIRHMPDGTRLYGAANDDPFDNMPNLTTPGSTVEKLSGDTPAMATYRSFAVPWIESDIHNKIKKMGPKELGALFGTPGTFPRFNGSPFYTTKIISLIGLRDRKYIDHTATFRHRGPGDVMRYAAVVSSADSADFGPHRILSDAQRRIPWRHPDELLYALVQYLYSLEPPPNPNPVDERAAAGRRLFEAQGCALCHTPPLYTNNKLTLAAGYKPAVLDPDTMNLSVNTDPNLAMITRKGTGYYKIPSLKGVWYRGLYLHDGAVASLEDMFDPARLREDYVPTGFKGFGPKHHAVPGHEFGLKLPPEQRAELIAFLRTL